MQNKIYLPLIGLLVVISSCRKDPVTKPVEFKSTAYNTLSSYDLTGKPDNLLHESISPDLLHFIDTLLPDGRNLSVSHPGLFTNPEIGDITITQPSTVYITFVKQSGANNNSIAFYTYPTSKPPTKPEDIKQITYFFPSAGNLSPLQAGDMVNLGNFEPGISIGFVLMQDAWSAKKHDLNNDAVHFCTNDALNPEVDPKLKKHGVLISYPPTKKVLIGFEDVDRTTSGCDDDFNDVVVYATVTN
jgi:hypothetical protein